MEVRRWMVFPEHPDDNAVETTQLRHEVVRFAIAEINPPETCVSIPNKENLRKVQSRYPIYSRDDLRCAHFQKSGSRSIPETHLCRRVSLSRLHHWFHPRLRCRCDVWDVLRRESDG